MFLYVYVLRICQYALPADSLDYSYLEKDFSLFGHIASRQMMSWP